MDAKALQFKKMSPKEFEHWAPKSKQTYAKDKARANNLTLKEANEAAEHDFQRLLPDEILTQDNYFFVMKSAEEELIGHLWFCVRGALDNRKAFLCDIFIEETFRGLGFGKEAMRFLENEVKQMGLKEIGLHVFGFNETAIRLYQSLDYKTSDLVMSKAL